MRIVYALAVVPVVVVAALSGVVALVLGDVHELPMRFTAQGVPTGRYAPGWIALGFIPVVTLVVMASLLVSRSGQDRGRTVRNIIYAGLALIFAEMLYLALLFNGRLTG